MLPLGILVALMGLPTSALPIFGNAARPRDRMGATAQDISDRERGFTLTLPKGFNPDRKLLAASPDIIYAFVYGSQDDNNRNIVLLIEGMHGTIGQEKLNRKEMPPGFQGRLL